MSKLTLVPGGKNKPRQYANQTLILPGVGEVTFNDQGNLEVEASKALALVEATKESMAFYVDKNSLPTRKTTVVSDPPQLGVETSKTTGDDSTSGETKSIPAQVAETLGGQQLGKEAAGQTVKELQELTGDQSSDGDTSPEGELSEADQKALDELSAAAERKQEIAVELDKLDLAGLTKVAREFPDLTLEKISVMTDAKLKAVLLEKLIK